MDDTHTMSFFVGWKRKTSSLRALKTGEPIAILEAATSTLPNTAGWFGRWRPVANQDNDFLIDPEVQRTVSHCGIAGVFRQVSATVESMGAITNYTLEHLAPGDRMIISPLLRLPDAARAVRDSNTVPPLFTTWTSAAACASAN